MVEKGGEKTRFSSAASQGRKKEHFVQREKSRRGTGEVQMLPIFTGEFFPKRTMSDTNKECIRKRPLSH